MELLSPSTPLISLPAAAIDTETTGLDPRHARIVQIAALRVNGGQVDIEGTFQSLVNPGCPIPPSSSAVHGLRDNDVKDAHVFRKVWDDFDRFVGPRVMIGYRTGFDISVMKRECTLAGIEWEDRHWLCVQVLARLVSSTQLAVESIESLADWLGVGITDRHAALGDAKAAGAIWSALIPLLRQKGIQTLGEALSASGPLLQDGTKELQRQSAGIEADASSLEHQPPPLRIDSYAYRHRLADVMSAPPVNVEADATLRDAARHVIENRISSLIVHDNGRTGIVTERDILRGIAAEAPDGDHLRLRAIMSHPLRTMPASTHLYTAIGRMNRLGIRHLAVTGSEGDIIGVVTPRNLLRARANEAIILGDEIESVSDGPGLAAARAKFFALAKGLLADGLDARNICAVISAELCNLTRRAAEIAEMRMEQASFGKPPVSYAVMVLGSAGRGESLLVPDQTNALVYEAGAPGGKEDQWFEMLGVHIADLLDEAGVPYSQSGVMAKNAEWRKSRDDWRATIDEWVQRSRSQDLPNVDIFFDGVSVHGASELADDVWRYAHMRAQDALAFQGLLTESARQRRSPVNVFGGFHADKGDRTDLKRGGMMPISAGARVLSIKHQLFVRSTAERLRASARNGVMSEDTVESIAAAQETILKTILEQQLADLEAGVPLSSLVETGRLGARDRTQLRQALRDVDALIDIVSEARG